MDGPLDSWLVRANTSIQETRKLTSEEINAAFNEITQITSEVAEMETLFKSLSRRFQVIKQTNKKLRFPVCCGKAQHDSAKKILASRSHER